ncbi:hypothetical protein HDU97_001234 [Phlyctochytrium planicorne]|nr:hypothetical protein HDU97_001234 [Phlyctochytrium planicorne]
MASIPVEILEVILENLYPKPLVDTTTRCTRSWFSDLNESIIDHERRSRREFCRSMFNCILVCREWARVGMKLLWRNPYLANNSVAEKLLDIVSEEEEMYGMFPYQTYVKTLNLCDFGIYTIQRLLGRFCAHGTAKAVSFVEGAGAGLTLNHGHMIQFLSEIQTFGDGGGIQELTMGGIYDMILESGANAALQSFSPIISSLRHLDLGFCRWVGDEMLKPILAHGHNLSVLDLGSTAKLRNGRPEGIHAGGFTSLARTLGSRLKVLSLSGSPITTVNVTTFRVFQACCGDTIEGLCIAGCLGVDDEICELLSTSFKALKSLDLSECLNVTPAGWLHIFEDAARRLENLSVAHCEFDDSLLEQACVASQYLRYIDISESNRRDGESYRFTLSAIKVLVSKARKLKTLVAARWKQEEVGQCRRAVFEITSRLPNLDLLYHGLYVEEGGLAGYHLMDFEEKFAEIVQDLNEPPEVSTGWCRPRIFQRLSKVLNYDSMMADGAHEK